MERDPKKRLGSSIRDADELREHEFFADIDWKLVAEMKHEPYYKPKVKGEEDTSRIDKLFTKEPLKETLVDPSMLTKQEKKMAHFNGFTYAEKGPLGK